MAMIEITAGEIYYNTQVYFRKHYIDNLPNDDKVWAKEYREWLRSQGAEIVSPNGNCAVTALGVAPFYDKFVFKNDRDATMFLLRWL